MAKAKRIRRMKITMNTDEIIKHLEKLQWLLRHNCKLDAELYPGLIYLPDSKVESVLDRIKDTLRYLKHIPISDLFTDDELKLYGIH